MRFAMISVAVVALTVCGCIHTRPCPVPVITVEAKEAEPAGRAPDSAVADAIEPTPAPATRAPAIPQAREVARVRFAAVGDVISHGDVLRSAEAADVLGVDGKSVNHEGFSALLEEVSADLAGHDLAFANLETPIAPDSGARSVPFMFNAPPALVEALQATGFNLLSFANNHVYDQRRAGLDESLRRLDATGVTYAGAGRSCAEARRAKLVERKGIRVAFLATSRLYNQRLNRKPDEPCAAEFDEPAVLAEVAAARKAGADWVVLSIHWGAEYHTAPAPSDVELAHRLLEGGVDVILGHHPHVLQPVEIYRAADGRLGLIAYSLGNFLSNQSRFYVHGVQPAKMGNPRDGTILRFSVRRVDYGQGQVRTELADVSVQPLWTRNNALDRQRDGSLPVIIRPVADDRSAALIQTCLACLKDPKARVELMRRLRVVTERRAIAAGILGEDLLRDPIVPEKKPCGAGAVD